MKKYLIIALAMACMQLTALAQDAPESSPKGQNTKQNPHEQAKEIEKLVSELSAEDWEVRDKAGRRLAEIGKPAIPALVETLKSEDMEARTRAEEILKKLHWVSLEDCEKIDDLVKEYAAKAKKQAESDEEQKAKKNAIKEIIENIKKIKNSDFYLVGKLSPKVDSDKKVTAEVISGVLNLTYWTGADGYSVRGNKIVMEDGEELDMPAGPWRIEEKGDKIYINGMELQLPAKIEKDVPPSVVLGKIVGGGQGSVELKLDALEILTEMKDKQAVPFIIRALKSELKAEDENGLKLQFEVLVTLSRIVEDGPSHDGDGKNMEEIRKAASGWKSWWKKARNEEPYNK